MLGQVFQYQYYQNTLITEAIQEQKVYLVYRVQLVEEFMRGFANNIPGNVHVEILYGRDAHHMAEASFKGLARALYQACQVDPRRKGKLPTTKEAW